MVFLYVHADWRAGRRSLHYVGRDSVWALRALQQVGHNGIAPCGDGMCYYIACPD